MDAVVQPLLVTFDQSCHSWLPALPVMYVQVCEPPVVGRVPVQSTLASESPEVEVPESAADLDELELELEAELPPFEPVVEVEPEVDVLELPELPPVDVPPLDCELPPELPPEVEPPAVDAPELVPELDPPGSLPVPLSLEDELHAAARATSVGRRVRRPVLIQDLPGRERWTEAFDRSICEYSPRPETR